MSGVSRIYSERPVSKQVNDDLEAFDKAITAAIDQAKQAGVPQGLLVAVLHGHDIEQTQRMMEMRRDSLER